jgi:hypothetical protein
MTRKGLTGGPGLDEWIRDLVDSGIGIDLRPGPAGSLEITPAPLPPLPRAQPWRAPRSGSGPLGGSRGPSISPPKDGRPGRSVS